MTKSQNKISKFENMWIFAMFDLPVTDKEKRNDYTRFRKYLLAEGFSMLQYSVYAKFCYSRESGTVMYNHIKAAVPPEGQVRIIMITDKQFEEMAVFYGKCEKNPEKPPEQLLLF